MHVHPVNVNVGRQMVAALNVNGYNTSTPEILLKKSSSANANNVVLQRRSSKNSNESGATTTLAMQQQSEHDRQLDLHLAAISRIQQR